MASVAILVGGRATRFGGRDKSALIVGGQSILERQIAELSRLTEDLLIVTGHDGGPMPTIRLKPDSTGITSGVRLEAALGPAHGPSVRVVPDRVRDSGPLGGLDAALAAARDDVLMLVAGDMPFVTAALAGYLLTLAPEADAVVPRTERGYHPLCAAYTRACVPAIAARLRERRLKMLDLLEDVRVRVVTGDTAIRHEAKLL
jgi:molybdopterin-guanine dinucleotide biosynthesis protein A